MLPEGTPAADDTSAGLSPALKILGAFLMLRLIIPLITSPEKMGLLDEPSAPGSEPVYRNTLKIVAKVCLDTFVFVVLFCSCFQSPTRFINDRS